MGQSGPGSGTSASRSSTLPLSAAALWVLLPASAAIHYPTFLGIYVIAMTLGAVSNVPGGLGVFESALLLMLPTPEPGLLLGSLLLFRAVYYIAPFTLALLMLATREATALRDIGLHDVEQLGDHRQHTFEVSRSEVTAQAIRQMRRVHRHSRRLAFVHLLVVGREDRMHTARLGQRNIACASCHVQSVGKRYGDEAKRGLTQTDLLPSLNRARETANRVKCASNLRQLYIAMMMYAQDNKGYIPDYEQYKPNPVVLYVRSSRLKSSRCTAAVASAMTSRWP